eukprot:TRINITY_DN31154_c0_g1_i1.p1 TRINITY_DN31154_c0_g1~~TRINITY_DN31154_c0_g1_i1.p1  ORF type:complete len:460 (+),score=61.78 TRINITY_DN31154_c0_g1_i1:56-1435(+)
MDMLLGNTSAYNDDDTVDYDSGEDSEAESVKNDEVSGTSNPQTVFNIVKNIVGEGMLSLPAGVAAGTGLGVGISIATGFGVAMAYTFSLMGRVCHATGGKTFKQCGERVVGQGFAEFMAIILMVKTSFTCVSYAIVIGHSVSDIFEFFGWEGIMTTKQGALFFTMLFVLVPLVLQRDLSILAYTSLIGIIGEVSVVLYMQVRLLDGSYAEGGQYYNATTPKLQAYFPDGGPDYWGISIQTVVFLGSLSTAFIAHYNAPKFYSHMKERSAQNFNKVVGAAFVVAYIIYVWIMIVGYLTFGAHCNGDILQNYSTDDPGATMGRIAISAAVICGFPLSFTALRDATISVFGLEKDRKRVFFLVTFCLLIPINTIAFHLDDLGLVNSLGGAIFGSLITMIFPGVLIRFCYINLEDKFSRMEANLNWVTIGFGVCLLCFGTTVNYMKKCAPEYLGMPPLEHSCF